ncbi:apoptotic chromatin condensation inducer in the nucleus isoform X1 [Aphis gossypii]|uniref:apoptotic chromatin condensation inducer in the nucleus isoform X1 n=1 Tax=Aphis gossypii TaxID=80765 RepID=UPI002159A354|nr:apoptotic chromatin condensation inducer in the nucleus isoform X1 [Aphis gossypii]
MSKRTGRKPKRERTSRRRTRRHSSTSETSVEDVPPPPKVGKTRASSRVDESERKVALTIKLPKPESNDCSEENTTGMWKVECSNGSDGDIQKLKISLRRSPKDLLREQAAEAKYSAERREKEEAASSSTNPSMLDGSVTNYLEQFGSTVAVEESEQNIVDSSEQVQVVIPSNEENIDNDQIDSVEVSSEFITSKEEPIVENITINENAVNVTQVEENTIHEEVLEPAAITVESTNPTNSSEDFSDSTVRPSIDECNVSEPILEENSVNVSEPVLEENSVNVSEVIDTPIALSETIQDIVPESIENVVDEPSSSEVLESVSNVDINKIPNNTIIEEVNKSDYINDSEQMEDVVQLTVESPDLVDDEDPKLIDDEPKPVYEEELNSVDVSKTESVDEIKPIPINEDASKLVDSEETKSIEESYNVSSSDIPNLKQVDAEKELNEMPKPLSSHPKRKWGSCKTRTPITISPFTLGTIIESNGDFNADNGEYRSEEGEIQRTDSDEEQDVEEPMELNDTMLIDHEAVDYEAPEEEEKPFIDNDDNKSDKSLVEEKYEEEPKKKSSVKRITTSSVIRITNLVRPFTVGQLRDLLQRTGKIVSNGFWMDTIKSQCIVEYENEEQAIETVYALNDSQWPSTNPKFLRVVFTNKDELNKALNGTHPERLDKQKESKVEKLRTQVDNNFILREWDRGKLEDMNGEKDDKSIKRKISDDDLHVTKDKKFRKDEKDQHDKRKKSKSKTPERIPTKSLDELFRKTKTTPTLYWSPLSMEQIAEKEDQRRKHLAEMERSQKTDRRRRDNLHYPKRR